MDIFIYFFRNTLRFNGVVVDLNRYILYVNVFKPSLTNYPCSEKFSLELLPEEYLELSRVVGWNLFPEWLTAKSCLRVAGSFPDRYFTGF